MLIEDDDAPILATDEHVNFEVKNHIMDLLADRLSPGRKPTKISSCWCF